MNEPAEKTEQARDSQSGTKAHSTLRHIRELRPFQEALEAFNLPASRVIGVEQLYKLHGGEDHMAAPQWASVSASETWKVICALPRVMPDACFGWTCDYVPETDMFSYIVSVLTPADTPVPDGCQFRDIPETLVAAGRWDEPMDQVIQKLKSLGYVTNYDTAGCGWNAELYLDKEESRPAPGGQEWRWLIPCRNNLP